MESHELYQSFDGRVWAKEFVETQKRNARVHILEFEDGTQVRRPTPFTEAEAAKAKYCFTSQSVAEDQVAMETWFCGALMRGYDEKTWRSKEYKRSIRRAMVPWWRRWLVPLSRFGR